MVLYRVQHDLKQRMIESDTEAWHADLSELRHVAGVDISFIKGDDVNACAALVIVSFPNLEVSSYAFRMNLGRLLKVLLNTLINTVILNTLINTIFLNTLSKRL